MSRCYRLCLSCLLLFLVFGCGNSDLARVTGVVTMDGKPVEGVSLEFTPVAGGRPSVALSDEYGKYEANYTHNERGAQIGQHKVNYQIFAASGDVSEEDEFFPPSRIQGGGSDLGKGRKLSPDEIAVVSGKNEIDFELIKKK